MHNYDVVIRNGTVYEGTGQLPVQADIAIRKVEVARAENLKIIEDHATFEQPHQYSTGVVHVLVNGVPVLKDGEHTGATPGRVLRGPGWAGRPSR